MEGESGVGQTSVLAFRRAHPEELRGLQKEVYRVILENRPISDRKGASLSKHPRTGKPIEINVYVPRRNELMHDDKVQVACYEKDPLTGNTVKWWEVR